MTTSRHLAILLNFAWKLCDFHSDAGSWLDSGKWNIGLKCFSNWIDVLGNALWVLLQYSYLYLLQYYIIVHSHKEIHRWFFWRKSAQDTGIVLKMAIYIQFRKKNGVHDFKCTCTTSLECNKQYIITKEFYGKQSNQSRHLFHWNIPQISKIAAIAFWCEFFLKEGCLWFTADFKGRHSSFELLWRYFLLSFSIHD